MSQGVAGENIIKSGESGAAQPASAMPAGRAPADGAHALAANQAAGTTTAAGTAAAQDAARDTQATMAGAKSPSILFGEAVSILMRSAQHKQMTLADLEWLLVPPLMLGQLSMASGRLKDAKGEVHDKPVPLGLTLWARVSEEMDKRLCENLQERIRLAPHEWASGEICWLIDMVAPPELGEAMFAQLQAGPLKGKAIKLRTRGADGKILVRVVKSAAGNSAGNEEVPSL